MTNDNHKEITEMFNVALVYRNVVCKLNEIEDMSMLIPIQVNAALTLELYLKIICKYENGEFKNIHKLDLLFDKLSCGTKNIIKSDFQKLLNNRNMSDIDKLEYEMKKSDPSHSIARNFDSLLKEWGRVFVEARYWYELKGKKLNMILFPEIDDVLRSYIEKNILPNLA